MPDLKVIISGGGTGGHIFPAIAIANALRELKPGIDILFIGAKNRMEMEKVPAAGYPIKGLWISGLQRKITARNLLFPLKVVSSLLEARRIITEFRPDVVAGTGGYASGPTLRTAARMGIPTLIQEQNSFPGITNKLLGARVSRICVAYDGMEKFFPEDKIIFTGNPVRQDITELEGKKEPGLAQFGLSAAKKTLLVIGGSLGARTINESIHRALPLLAENGLQVIWQTGKGYYPLATEAVKPFENAGIRAFDFIRPMDLAYAAADLIVSRAGAIAISELCTAGKPAILVPSPNVAEDHQSKNALALTSREAAILVKDRDAVETLGMTIVDLLHNAIRQEDLSRNILILAKPGAARAIALEILKLAGIQNL